MRLTSVLVAASILTTMPELSALQAATARPKSGANTEQQITRFNRAVEQYDQLHRRLEGPVSTVRVSEDLVEVQRAIADLAQKIRLARSNARQGDLFTPEIAAIFRQRIGAAIKDDYVTLSAMVDEDNPEVGRMHPRVNDSYPTGLPVSLMPPAVLSSLPTLPDDLQFRFMDRNLILWDRHANLIVDYFPDAIPAR